MAQYAAMLLAHPVTESVELGVTPALVAMMAVVGILGLAVLSTRRGRGTASGSPAALTPLGPPDVGGPAMAAWRVLGGSLLLLAVLTGRLGEPGQLDNIATPLVIGLGWPLLLLLSMVTDIWGRLAPFDGIARLLARLAGRPTDPAIADADADGTPRENDWRRLDGVAIAGALGWTWWLTAYQPGLAPRAIGLALGTYAILTWTGCLMVGRRRWLGHAEVVTVLLGAVAATRHQGQLALSAGHRVALAVLLGGLVAAELRFSRWFVNDIATIGITPFSEPATVIGFLLGVVVAGITVEGTWRWAARLRAADTVTTVLPWLVIGAGLSASVERDRLWTSAQLLVARLSNPFGGNVDLFGTADLTIHTWPFGATGRLALQLAVLLIPVMIGTVIALRRADRRTAQPAMALLVTWVGITTLSVATL